MTKKPKLVLALLLALTLIAMPLIGACKAAPPPVEKVISVGFFADYTGPVSTTLAPICDGHVDYFRYINEEKGGFNGVKVNFEWYDCKYDLDLCMSTYKRIKDHIMIMSGTYSHAALTWKELAAEDEIPYFSGANPAPAVCPVGDWLYLDYPPYHELMAGLLQWEKAKWTEARPLRVGVILVDSAMGWGTVLGLKDWCADNGIDYVAEEAFPGTALDVSAQLTKIMRANPDILIVAGTVDPASVCIKDARALGVEAEIAVPPYCGSEDLIRIVGPEIAEGVTHLNHHATTMPNYSTEGTKLVQEIFSKYRTGEMASCIYKGVAEGMIIGEAIRLTLEEVPFEELKPADFKYHGFDRMKDFETSGLTGAITYTPTDHRGTHFVFIGDIRDGKPYMLDAHLECPNLDKYIAK